MKKLTAVILAISILLLSAACTRPVPADALTAAERARLRNGLPNMDGSTSLIPLEAGLRAALFEIPYQEAYAQVKHSKTWDAFNGLLSGAVDLLLTTPLSRAQRQMAAEAELELEEVPVTREGFVFVVNAKNPVSSLTQAQLKGIYTGEIANWKELGGADAPIVAYQRNTDSGSQNYMLDFMGDLPLTEAPSTLRPGTMGYLMDAVAVNDHAENAIGYSVYAYAADMYRDTESVKFLAVDGVSPSRATIASGEYPLTGDNLAVFRADTPVDSPIRLMVKYMLSEEGQRAVADAGYAAVREIGYPYADAPGKAYREKGRGGKAPEALPDVEYVSLSDDETADDGCISLAPVSLPDGSYTYYADGVKDEALKTQIDAFLQKSVGELLAEEADFRARADGVPSASVPTRAYVSVRNAFLSATVSLSYKEPDAITLSRIFDLRTAVWDLSSGRRVAPEALFCDGVDIGSSLALYLRQRLADESEYGIFLSGETRAEPEALPTDGWALNADFLYFTDGNPFFETGVRIGLRGLPAGTMTAEKPYDPSAVLDGEKIPVYPRLIETQSHIVYVREESGAQYAQLDPAVYPAAAEINGILSDYMRTWFTDNAYSAFGKELIVEGGIYAAEYQGRYFLFQTPHPYVSSGGYYPYARSFLFDLTTGAEVRSADALLKEGWQSRADLGIYASQVSWDWILAAPVTGIRFVGPQCILRLWDKEIFLELRVPVSDFRF